MRRSHGDNTGDSLKTQAAHSQEHANSQGEELLNWIKHTKKDCAEKWECLRLLLASLHQLCPETKKKKKERERERHCECQSFQLVCVFVCQAKDKHETAPDAKRGMAFVSGCPDVDSPTANIAPPT